MEEAAAKSNGNFSRTTATLELRCTVRFSPCSLLDSEFSR